MVPTRQRLDPGDGVRNGAQLGLEFQGKLVVFESVSKVLFELGAFGHPLLQVHVEESDTIAPILFRAIHGDIRMDDKVARVIDSPVDGRDPDTRADGYLVPENVEGLIQSLQDRLPHIGQFVPAMLPRQQRHEFVASKAREDELGRANGAKFAECSGATVEVVASHPEPALDDPQRSLAQEFVPGIVPEGIVDALEPIQINEEHRALTVFGPLFAR